MKLQQRIELLTLLGIYLKKENHAENDVYYKVRQKNAWFSIPFLQYRIDTIVENYLIKDKLQQFAAQYAIPEETKTVKVIGQVLAGNIPLVGIHDLICTFLSGHISQIKLSSKDEVLYHYILNYLKDLEPEIANYFQITERLSNFDAIIATGSNNSGRYFEQYFAKYPNIIRKNRNGLVVITGKESEEEITAIGKDVFTFYGMGCRSISKLFVPENYDFVPILRNWEEHYNEVKDHNKYKNNYDYQLSILLVNRVDHLASENILLLENENMASPISLLHYQKYSNPEEVNKWIEKHQEEIQCVVSKNSVINNALPVGSAQSCTLYDYADHIDTMKFLKSV